MLQIKISKPTRSTKSTDSNEVVTTASTKLVFGENAAKILGLSNSKAIIFADAQDIAVKELVEEFGTELLQLRGDDGNLITDGEGDIKITMLSVIEPDITADDEIISEADYKKLKVRSKNEFIQLSQTKVKELNLDEKQSWYAKVNYDVSIENVVYNANKVTDNSITSAHASKVLGANTRCYNMDNIAVELASIPTGESYKRKIKGWLVTEYTILDSGLTWNILIESSEREEVFTKKEVSKRRGAAKPSVELDETETDLDFDSDEVDADDFNV